MPGAYVTMQSDARYNGEGDWWREVCCSCKLRCECDEFTQGEVETKREERRKRKIKIKRGMRVIMLW
jgi:hypothetical protein